MPTVWKHRHSPKAQQVAANDSALIIIKGDIRNASVVEIETVD
jgi:hypothetical protein